MSDTKQKPKRRRRWLSYSLRSLLVVITIFCIVLGYWTHRANRQKAVVKWVEENDGVVLYDFQTDKNGCKSKPPGPKWLQTFLGNDYLATVVGVYLNGGESIDLTPLAQLEQLIELNLFHTQTSDLTPLAGITSIKYLYLESTQVGDLTPLAGLTSIEFLNLTDTRVSDLTPLAGMTNLQDLLLQNTQVGDLTPLAELKKLESLHLNFTQVSDLTPLMNLTSLTSLNLHYTQVTQEQIDELQKALPNCTISGTPKGNANEEKKSASDARHKAIPETQTPMSEAPASEVPAIR